MDIKELHTDMMQTFAAFKAVHDKMEAEQQKIGHATGLTTEELKRLNERLDEIETKMNRPRMHVKEGDDPNENPLARKAYHRFIRKGFDMLSPDEKKAMATDDDTTGGYLVPQNISQNWIRLLVEFSPMRELATVESISLGNSLTQPKEGPDDVDAGWVGERQARPETQTPTIGGVDIPTFEQYAAPRVTQTMLDDTAFNIETWLAGRISRRFGIMEGTAFILGDGNLKPKGILQNVAASRIVNSGDAALITADGWLRLVYDLPDFYARSASIILKRSTVLATRLLKDGQGNYLWQPGLTAGSPSTILGYNYREAIDMPAIAANALAVAFGDWRSVYTIVDRQGIRQLRDPYTVTPFVRFYSTRRVGGQVVLDEGYRVLKIAA